MLCFMFMKFRKLYKTMKLINGCCFGVLMLWFYFGRLDVLMFLANFSLSLVLILFLFFAISQFVAAFCPFYICWCMLLWAMCCVFLGFFVVVMFRFPECVCVSPSFPSVLSPPSSLSPGWWVVPPCPGSHLLSAVLWQNAVSDKNVKWRKLLKREFP